MKYVLRANISISFNLIFDTGKRGLFSTWEYALKDKMKFQAEMEEVSEVIICYLF